MPHAPIDTVVMLLMTSRDAGAGEREVLRRTEREYTSPARATQLTGHRITRHIAGMWARLALHRAPASRGR